MDNLFSHILFLQSLGSLVAFQAMVSIATIGLYIAYALPIFFRVTLARKTFVPGPYNLGRYGIFVGWVSVLWVVTITVLFSLPVAYPITKDTLNYTPVAVGGLFILSVSSWILSARHWFKGPITNIDTWIEKDCYYVFVILWSIWMKNFLNGAYEWRINCSSCLLLDVPDCVFGVPS